MSAPSSVARIRYLIFDFDGTLADSVTGNAIRFAQLLERGFGLPLEESRRYFIETAGREMAPRFEGALRDLAGVTGVYVTVLLEDFFRGVMEGPVDVFPEVAHCFEALSKAGYRLSVSSANRPDILRMKLARSGLLPLVDLCLGQDPADPETVKGTRHFAALSAHYGVPPSVLAARGLFVGDGAHDAEVAREAGMPVAMRVGTLSRSEVEAEAPDYIVDDLYGVLRILEVVRPVDGELPERVEC